MDEYERLIAIEKINDYFKSKRDFKIYDPHQVRRRRRIKWDDDKRAKYRAEYYQANKEKLRAYAKAYYETKKTLRGHHTDI